ncbi:MAG: hypothetical protein RL734_657 [Bacteroidota bacterium]
MRIATFVKPETISKMNTTPEHNARMAKMSFTAVYPFYLAKIEKKGRTKEELHQVIHWLTGFDEHTLQKYINEEITFADFFAQATINPNAEMIKGMICGYRIEEIENTLTKQIRYLDKLVDELAKGKAMEKILRV